jgi:hypothetical protein
MAFLKRFFPFLMRASIRGPTSLAPDGRSCHAACGGKQRAKPLKQRTRSQVKHSLACAVLCRRIICFLNILVAPSSCDRERLREATSNVRLLGLPVRCGWRCGIHSVQVAALKFVSYSVL